ncbi:hypothetical protein Q8A72_13255, partial [Aeribacillus pallidus]|nr:hypothetical protein [Aeribacillus pallidus]
SDFLLLNFCGFVTSKILHFRGEVLFYVFEILMALGSKNMQNAHYKYEVCNALTFKETTLNFIGNPDFFLH